MKNKHIQFAFLSISKYILIFISVILLTITTPQYLYAQTSKPDQLIKVSPVILSLNLTPNTTTPYSITIENLTNKALPTTITFESFNTSDEIGGYIFDNSTSLLSRWLVMPTKDFILAPKEKRKIDIALDIPNEVPLGGYYGVIFINPVLSPNTTNITLAPKIGILLLANIGVDENQEDKIFIEEFSVPFISENGVSNYILRVKNSSLFHYSAKPKITLTSIFGGKRTIPLEEKYIFPGKIRKWEETLKTSSLPNIYKARLSLSTGNGKQIHSEKVIVVFPAFKFILIGIIVLFVILVAFKWRKIKKAGKIFLTNKE